ncbi:hypothetical protein BH20ACT13_BH20ACT13_04240 [soil metagenome]
MTAVALPSDRVPATTEAARLFEEYSEQLLGYCLGQLGSRSEAEDAVQTTFLYALRALRRGVVPECESAWLTTIAKNVCHSERRTVNRRGPLATDVDLDTIALGRRSDDEEELLLGFKDALASMPEKQRRALILREWQGVPSREIASELGLSAPATHALLTRARHSFAQALTVPRRPVVGVVWLLVELRSHLKALLGGISTKAALTSIAVVGVGVGGIAVDRSLADSKAPPAPGPTRSAEQPASASKTRDTSARATSPPRATRQLPAPRSRTSDARNTPTVRGELLPVIAPAATPLPAGHPERTPEPTPPATPPSAELPVELPVSQPQVPKVDLPTLVPPVDTPSLPVVELPPVPALPLPSDDPPLPAVPLP